MTSARHPLPEGDRSPTSAPLKLGQSSLPSPSLTWMLWTFAGSTKAPYISFFSFFCACVCAHKCTSMCKTEDWTRDPSLEPRPQSYTIYFWKCLSQALEEQEKSIDWFRGCRSLARVISGIHTIITHFPAGDEGDKSGNKDTRAFGQKWDILLGPVPSKLLLLWLIPMTFPTTKSEFLHSILVEPTCVSGPMYTCIPYSTYLEDKSNITMAP